jgi:hypothetical protein
MRGIVEKPVDYVILGNHSGTDLAEEVKKYLQAPDLGENKFWKPCGGISCGTVNDRVVCFVQALVCVELVRVTV